MMETESPERRRVKRCSIIAKFMGFVKRIFEDETASDFGTDRQGMCGAPVKAGRFRPGTA